MLNHRLHPSQHYGLTGEQSGCWTGLPEFQTFHQLKTLKKVSWNKKGVEQLESCITPEQDVPLLNQHVWKGLKTFNSKWANYFHVVVKCLKVLSWSIYVSGLILPPCDHFLILQRSQSDVHLFLCMVTCSLQPFIINMTRVAKITFQQHSNRSKWFFKLPFVNGTLLFRLLLLIVLPTQTILERQWWCHERVISQLSEPESAFNEPNEQTECKPEPRGIRLLTPSEELCYWCPPSRIPAAQSGLQPMQEHESSTSETRAEGKQV